MSAEIGSHDLIKVVALLGAAVVMVPIFRKLGLGSVLGYLAAGLIIGPFGLKLFSDPQAILHVAELGVVMFLFVIGLEMRPAHLWSLRHQIFGLGALQILVCTVALTATGLLFGYPFSLAFVGSAGFVLTSTAIVMQLLGERGDFAQPRGQKMVSILLFEDLLIVPLLAVVAFLSPIQTENLGASTKLESLALSSAALAALIASGIWLLNPLFRLLSFSKTREVMTAAALFVVLGAALLMQVSGLSMAMGAFIAGVLLAESTFRHQIEADIEPFRGLLLGLFFMGVGMALNLEVVFANFSFILSAVLLMVIIKALCVYGVARWLGANNGEAIDRATLMAQGGEFAFVLFSSATAAGVITGLDNANLTAIVVLSMALTPLIAPLVRKFVPACQSSLSDVEAANGLTGNVLMIGFGRFGQVVSQLLLARNVDVTIIDSNADSVRNAGEFGFKIYFGDGTRTDVLRAAGAGSAEVIIIAIDDKAAAKKTAELIKNAFPLARIVARAYDRTQARELLTLGVDYQIRETFESAVQMGGAALKFLGLTEEEVLQVTEEIRSRDAERFSLEMAAGKTEAGRSLLLGNLNKPTPLTEPQRDSQNLNDFSPLKTP